MSGVTRRQFNQGLAAVTGGMLATGLTTSRAQAQKGAGRGGRVVIIGGGVGGVSAAKFIRQKAPEINVTLVEPRKSYTSCFFPTIMSGVFVP